MLSCIVRLMLVMVSVGLVGVGLFAVVAGPAWLVVSGLVVHMSSVEF